MNNQVEEVRRIVECWFSYKPVPPIQDIMPHVVFLLEQYDLHLKRIAILEEIVEKNNHFNQTS